ncbi:hypothetical protein AX16_005100 [Volvariella volvacea WC 439]|nr:hypothetical protein AX16_005100 [Volvariella volvacea WC 439]
MPLVSSVRRLGPTLDQFIGRHQVIVTLGLSISVVLAAVLCVLFTVNNNGQSDFGVMSSIAPDANGVVLLGHIYKVDLTERMIGVSWHVGGCGSYSAQNAPISKGTTHCSLPNVPLDVYMNNQPEPVFSYDPDTQPLDPATEELIYLHAVNSFQADILLETYTQATKLGIRYKFFDQQYLYPFDYYVTRTKFITLDSSTNTTVPIAAAAFSDFANNFAPRSTNTPARTRFNGAELDSNVVSLTIRRNVIAKVYAVMLFLFNWALAAVVIVITVVATVAKDVELGEGVLILPVTVILTIPALRELFVGEPPIGVLLDVVGFFLQMFVVALCTIVLLAQMCGFKPSKRSDVPEKAPVDDETSADADMALQPLGQTQEKTALLSCQGVPQVVPPTQGVVSVGPSGAQDAARTAHAKAILGPELHAQLTNTKVLLVGAGGIGCELLKNIVLTGFGHITLLDLDTIDLSNLNRQFLFRKKDVKQSKALVAARTAADFNPNVRITPIHGNIKEPQYDIAWFKQFDIVLNALDNLGARRHVNKMCMAAQIPLVESGTAGYLGQVQPLVKDRTECFDCVPKPTPKTFPVCTIRSTPSQPIHCIVWSKSYLMGQLFGEDEDAGAELDEAEKQGENAQEIAALRKEALAFQAVRRALRFSGQNDAAKMVFQKVFDADIRNLLSMSDMWRSRQPPVPLDFDKILDGSFVLERKINGQQNGVANGPIANGHANGSSQPASRLKDQQTLTLRDNVLLFISSINRLAARLQQGEQTISFDKDDDDTLDFVTATSNLRSTAYGIETKTRWEVKEMAGNIIPAIATTNAIISGLIVLQALHLLRQSYHKLRNVHLQFKPAVPLSTITMSSPNPNCGICRDMYINAQCDPARTRLGDIVQAVLDGEGREVSVFEDKRLLSDPDWTDNDERTLESLNVTKGKFLSIVDEDDEVATISVSITDLPPNHPIDAPPFILPSPVPKPPAKVKPAVREPSPPRPAVKRAHPDDEITEIEPAAKRVRQSGADDDLASPSKKRRLEEDGLVMMGDANDMLEDEDVIIID